MQVHRRSFLGSSCKKTQRSNGRGRCIYIKQNLLSRVILLIHTHLHTHFLCSHFYTHILISQGCLCLCDLTRTNCVWHRNKGCQLLSPSYVHRILLDCQWWTSIQTDHLCSLEVNSCFGIVLCFGVLFTSVSINLRQSSSLCLFLV